MRITGTFALSLSLGAAVAVAGFWALRTLASRRRRRAAVARLLRRAPRR